jgi:hypothetical protein
VLPVSLELPKPVLPFALSVVPVTVIGVAIGEIASHAASARSMEAASAANGIKAIPRRRVKALTPHIFFMSMAAFCSIQTLMCRIPSARDFRVYRTV